MKHIAKRDHANFNHDTKPNDVANDLNAFIFDNIVLNFHIRVMIIILH